MEGFTPEPVVPNESEKTEDTTKTQESFSESEKENMVNEAKTFPELFDVIKKIGSVEGSQKTYGYTELLSLIMAVRNDELKSSYITSKYNLRNAVEKLIPMEEDRYRKEDEFTSEDRAQLLKTNLERLSELHGIAADNQQRRIRGEISGVRADEEDSHIQKTISEVEDEIKSLRGNA